MEYLLKAFSANIKKFRLQRYDDGVASCRNVVRQSHDSIFFYMTRTVNEGIKK